MSNMSAAIQVLNFLGLGGVGIFIYYLFKGLSQRIKTLTEITKEQDKTLQIVRERALEMERWREDYKKIIDDFQDLGSKLDARRNELINELEDANKKKDTELAELKSAQLKEIELRQKSYEKVKELEQDLKKTKDELEHQYKILDPKLINYSKSFNKYILSCEPVTISYSWEPVVCEDKSFVISYEKEKKPIGSNNNEEDIA